MNDLKRVAIASRTRWEVDTPGSENLAALGGESLSMSAAAFELSPAVSYAISDAVSVGVGYRATYMLQDAHQVTATTDAAGNPTLIASDLSLSGFNFAGVQVGVLVRPAESTRIGLAYRNKVTVDLDGDLEVGGAKLDASSEFSAPHTFKLGLAQDLMNHKLMLALDLKYALYSDSSEKLSTTVEGMGTSDSPLNWNDSVAIGAGAEYRLADDGPALRAGYSVTKSATPEDYPQPILAPPGWMHSVHAGAGMTLSSVELALGGYYLWGSAEDVTPAADAVGEAGKYGINAFVVALSASYRL